MQGSLRRTPCPKTSVFRSVEMEGSEWNDNFVTVREAEIKTNETASGIVLDPSKNDKNQKIGYVVGFGPLTGYPVSSDKLVSAKRPPLSSDVNWLEVGRKVVFVHMGNSMITREGSVTYYTIYFPDVIRALPVFGFADEETGDIVELTEEEYRDDHIG